jgi:ParB family chromosome partitioning protein
MSEETTEKKVKKSKKALDYPATEMFKVPPEELVVIGIDTADTAATHPFYDRRVKTHPPTENMIQSLEILGQLQPVTVTKNGKREDGTDIIEVIFGQRRVRSMRIANERRKLRGNEPPMACRCVVATGDELRLLMMRKAENAIRQDDEPLQIAEDVAEFLRKSDDRHLTCVTFGITDQTLKHYLTVAGLHTEVKKQIKAGKLSPAAAAPLAKYPLQEQPTKLEEVLTDPKIAKASKPEVQRKLKELETGEKQEKGVSKKEWNAILKAVDAEEIALGAEAYELIKLFLGKAKVRPGSDIHAALKHVRKAAKAKARKK